MATKKQAPISRKSFMDTATPSLPISIDGSGIDAIACEFSSGSFGWKLNGKVNVKVNGVNVPCQVGMNVVVIGSVNCPKESAALVAN